MATTKALSVAVRCRTVLPHDRDQRVCVRTTGDREIECLDPEQLHKELREKHGRQDYLKENHNRARAYTFDLVFGPAAKNIDLFEQLARPLIPQVLAGKHGTCFAYGQTGSGKTHTMLGRQGEAGLVQCTLERLLGEAGKAADANVTVTFVEVYNEKIRDLLSPRDMALDLREDPIRGPCLAGNREVSASTADDVMKLVLEGNSRRTEETTAANPVSSRSHAVLQLHIETMMKPPHGAPKKRFAKLSLIDLAGSERAANTGNRGDRLREGAMINKSLLALANCITALTRKGAYVNYRDSKLTRLLKDSLSGNAYTVMVAHVSPSIASFEETVNTLKYAHRACEIRGMSGGVRENVSDVAPYYADRLAPVMDATRGLQKAVARLVVPPSLPPAPPLKQEGAGLHPSQSKVPAIELADAVARTCRKVVGSIRDRVRVEQTALELSDQNERNEVELSKLELDVMLGAGAPAGSPAALAAAAAAEEAKRVGAAVAPAPHEQHLKLLKRHGALQAATRRNNEQRQRIELRSARSQQAKTLSEQKNEAELLSLLSRSRKVIEGDGSEGDVSELERRLLQSQHALALLEIERIEAEQSRALLEAAGRKHEVALRKQKLQLDVYARALGVAEALLQQQGLIDKWHSALGPLVKLLPQHVVHETPSLDELIAEVSAPATPVRGSSRPSSVMGGDVKSVTPPLIPPPSSGSGPPEEDYEDAAELREIDEGFLDMRTTLNQSLKNFAPLTSGDPDDDEEYDAAEEFPDEEDQGD
mmetsp:Transcript_38149/g.89478  ORF Transcript_38149/g.89478 Transcript_38149/m.89478 type:complete len:763 (-) Transcript_38149:152-2440(-)|eukprot:CAMPEP_0178388946 /NCGR_PEP_ID=MMETSP0689_2-20121128/9855_1 /TAXON_ID=160604 /ORGANISM="Amphidinium massartii, Strain CS-259" /LENGTH=762 /DNA_ID=CAMNT_0020009365 /DNA_START=36 /DNA_END=2324 /DNA_ORIENTATION=+